MGRWAGEGGGSGVGGSTVDGIKYKIRKIS